MTVLLIAGTAVLLTIWGAAFRFVALVARQVRRLDEVLGLRAKRAAEPAGGPPPVPSRLPSLTVVVTACNEAEGIEATLRRLLEQRFDRLSIVVVDDRSTDATGALADRVAAAAGPRIEVLHNTTLPEGWIGKCNACRLGAERARGDWILFMDGDVELVRDDLLARIVAMAEARGIDHIAITPDVGPMSPLQSAVLGVFGQMFMVGALAHEMDRDRPRGGGGIGAFNLVRRTAYDRVGGHGLLKMDPGDDFKLGRLLKESGARQRLYDGVGLVRCFWHRGVPAVVRGLEKNFFAGFDYSVAYLAGFTALVLLLYLGPVGFALAASAAAGPGAAAVAWSPLLLQALTQYRAARNQVERQGGNPIAQALLYPVGALVLLVAIWNSAFRTLTRGGIVWRGTFYPLDALRRGIVRRGAGRRPAPPPGAGRGGISRAPAPPRP